MQSGHLIHYRVDAGRDFYELRLQVQLYWFKVREEGVTTTTLYCLLHIGFGIFLKHLETPLES